ARGLDDWEDLASPGVFRFALGAGEATLVLAAEGHEPRDPFAVVRAAEATRRGGFATPMARAADAYLVRRGRGKTIVAGYPWFTDWGRDTFIALRGLCLAVGRFDDARAILLEWAGAVSEGMLPNRFADYGEQPEYNAVDAALWYVVAVHAFIEAVPEVSGSDRERVGDPRRLRAREAPRYTSRRRRAPRRRRAGRAAHLDGRQGGRSGRDPARRQAGRGPGALGECAPHRRRRRATVDAGRGAGRSRV